MFDDDQSAEKPPSHVVGEDLSDFSVGDLEERIGLLEAEIERLRADLEQKRSGRAAADSFFKI